MAFGEYRRATADYPAAGAGSEPARRSPRRAVYVRKVAGSFADSVDIPYDWRCCAFAGDRGLLHPELTASATSREIRGIQWMIVVIHPSNTLSNSSVSTSSSLTC